MDLIVSKSPQSTHYGTAQREERKKKKKKLPKKSLNTQSTSPLSFCAVARRQCILAVRHGPEELLLRASEGYGPDCI